MITQETRVGQIEITENYSLQIRLHLKIFNDGVQLGNTQYHRLTLDPDTDAEIVKQANNAHLQQMGWPVIPADQWNEMLQHKTITHTAQRIKDHKDKAAATKPNKP